MIEAEALTRRYGDFCAVSDVSFAIEQGEIVGLLGHNGAGKTTIMKMLTGYLEPSSGSVKVDGVAVEHRPLEVQQRLGYLPENLPLYPELSVVDYLAYAAQLRGVQPRTAVANAIAATGLEEKALDPIATLSRGFKQRVGVAQAILHTPRFLILDEPTNGLDPSQTQHMRDLIQKLATTATVILSTHIMQEVDAICDRAIILRSGELVLDERLADLQVSDRYRVRTAPGRDLADLLAADSAVSQTRDDGQGSWTVTVSGERDAVTGTLAQQVTAAGWPLYELGVVKRDLESVFREVNEESTDAA